MGLAASQARFLGITARKSNIEYEGQQVNQQRTALAEEVNSLYSKILALEVPVAPDATKFYESDYSFELSNVQEEYNGNYLIKNYYQNSNGNYTITTQRTFKRETAIGTKFNSHQYKIEEAEDKSAYYFVDYDNNKIELQKETDEEKTKYYLDLIRKDNPYDEVPEDSSLYYYSDKEGLHYVLSDIVENFDKYKDSNFSTYFRTTKDDTDTKVFEDVQLTFDSNNRISYINIPSIRGNAEVNTTRVYDQEGYDAALRDYTMSQAEYDKAIADLNAQTESLQQEDKVLELRLNQIDTEQNELQTELEAVKAVLDKNVENTFKTFA